MTYDFKNHPLPILVSTRIRLSKEQREQVKQEYYKLKNELCVPVSTSTHTGLAVETRMTDHEIDKRMGMSSLVFSDVIASRDSLSIGVVLKIQRALDIELITEKDLLSACKNYINYVFNEKDS